MTAKRNQSLELTAAALDNKLDVRNLPFYWSGLRFVKGEVMWKRILIAVIGVFALVDQAASQSVRGAFLRPASKFCR